MCGRTVLPALLLGMGLMGLMAAPTPAETPDAGRIAKLIEQLGSDTFAERQKATDALDAIGEPALEALRKASTSKDAEIRKRSSDLASKIESRVTSARILKPTLLHLVYKDAPLTEAVADFRKKSGYDIVLHDPDGKMKARKITLDTGKVSFWNALEQFCAKAGLAEGDPNAGRYNARVIGQPGGVFIVPLNPAGKVVPPVAVPRKVQPAQPGGQQPAKETKKDEQKKEDAKKAAEQKEEAKKKAAAGQPVPGVVPVAPRAGGIQPARPAVAVRPWIPVQPGQITLMPGAPASKVVDTNTSVRIRPADKKNFRISEKEIELVLQITPEPKYRWQQTAAVLIDKAIDDNDQKLTPIAAPADPAQGGIVVNGGGGVIIIRGAWGPGGMQFTQASSNGLTHSTTVRLKPEAKPSKSLKELTGTIGGRVLTEAEHVIAVDNVMKTAGKSFQGKQSGEIKVLTATKQADGTCQITFEFEMPKDVVAETQIAVPQPAPVPGAKGPQPAAVPRAVLPGGAIVGGRVVVQRFAYNGLTLRDAKGNVLPATVLPNWNKGGVRGAAARMEYIATYKPAGKDAPEAARLVFTARHSLAVNVPFTLKNIELK